MSPNPTQSVAFQKQDYAIVNYLGGGMEGRVFRVQNVDGQFSIIKFYRKDTTMFSWEAIRYLAMRFSRRRSYKIIAVDFSNKAIRFEDLRGIPIQQVEHFLIKANAPLSLIEKAKAIIARKTAWFYYPHNQVFDIDNFAVVPIDPQ